MPARDLPAVSDFADNEAIRDGQRLVATAPAFNAVPSAMVLLAFRAAARWGRPVQHGKHFSMSWSASQSLLALATDFLHWLPGCACKLPNVQYGRIPPFSYDYRDKAAAIVKGVEAISAVDAELLRRSFGYFYETVDRVGMPRTLGGGQDGYYLSQCVRIPVARRGTELENYLTRLRERIQSSPKPKPRKRASGKPRKPRPLTCIETETMQIVGECKGNIAAAARRLGKDRKTVEQAYRNGLSKVGKEAYWQNKRAKTRLLARDKRGQEAVSTDDERF